MVAASCCTLPHCPGLRCTCLFKTFGCNLSAGTLPQMACITLKHGASSWQTSLIRSLASQPSFCATQLEVSLHAAAACATTADLTGKKPLPWTWSSLEGAPFCEGCGRPPMQSPSRHEVEPPLQASPRCRQPRSSPGWCGVCSCRMCRCACCTAASRIASSAHWSKRCRTLCGRPAWVRCSSSRLHQPRCGPLSVSHHKVVWVAAIPCTLIAVGTLLSGCCPVRSSRGSMLQLRSGRKPGCYDAI